MSTSAQLAPGTGEEAAATSQNGPRGGPVTDAGKAISSRNATRHGLFATHDFIRPGEEPLYTELDESLRADLTPNGLLEHNLVDEIRRSMWRLRRCGEVEAHLIIGLDDGGGFIFDPMESSNPDAAKVQLSVDRARSQAHRLLHKCTAELRKLQTERLLRNESIAAGADISHLGISDLRAVRKGLHEHFTATDRRQKLAVAAELEFFRTPSLPSPVPTGEAPSSFCKTPAQTPRNAACPCGSGLKHKRCCGKGAPAMLHAA